MNEPSSKLASPKATIANENQKLSTQSSAQLLASEAAALKPKPNVLLDESDNKSKSAPVVDSKTQSPVGGSLNDQDPVLRGKTWYQNFGCVICHSTDGSDGMGPTWSGIWGKEGKNTENQAYKVDAKFIIESVRNPGANVAQGYQNIMPPFDEGQLSDDQIRDLTKFMQSISK